MWLAVDRIEGDTVVLMDDDEVTYHLSAQAYIELTGCAPTESTVLQARVEDGRILSAACDGDETQRRLAAARARLDRLIHRQTKK